MSCKNHVPLHWTGDAAGWWQSWWLWTTFDRLSGLFVFPVSLLPLVAQGVPCPSGHRWCCVTPVLYKLPLLSHHLAQDYVFCTYIVTNGLEHLQLQQVETIVWSLEPSPPVHQLVCCSEDTGYWSVHLSPSVSLSTTTTPSRDAPVTGNDLSNCIDPSAHRTGWKLPPQRYDSLVRFHHPGWGGGAAVGSRPQRRWSSLSSPPQTSYMPSVHAGRAEGVQTQHITCSSG